MTQNKHPNEKQIIAGYMVELRTFRIEPNDQKYGLVTSKAIAYTIKKKLAASVIWFSFAKNVRKDKIPE